MIYWDSSAIVAFCIEEALTPAIRDFLEKASDPRGYTAGFSLLEVESAFQIKISTKSATAREIEDACKILVELRRNLASISLDENALMIASNLQKLYRLRPGDSAQLASARIGTNQVLKTNFLSLDKVLTQAAQKEGFGIPKLN